VPQVSPTTRAIVARVPRSLPQRKPAPEPMSELATRIGQSSAPPQPAPDLARGAPVAQIRTTPPPPPTPLSDEPAPALTDAPTVAGSPLTVPVGPEPVLPTARLSRGATLTRVTPDGSDGADGIELPTMIEPRAQRSPWAWAAPPEWSRDEDDEPVSQSSRRA
jgi:hypothetical protein